MFDFYNDIIDLTTMERTYAQRNVDNYKCDDFVIDTSLVPDRPIPYECAIAHKDFNHGNFIILGWAPTKEEAKKMHLQFVEYFTNEHVDEIEDAYDHIIYKRKDDN